MIEPLDDSDFPDVEILPSDLFYDELEEYDDEANEIVGSAIQRCEPYLD